MVFGRQKMSAAFALPCLRRILFGVAFTTFVIVLSTSVLAQTHSPCGLAPVIEAVGGNATACDPQHVRNLANHGSAFEQNQMGLASILRISPEYPSQDALKWFEKAARQGYAPAEVNLGVMYANGWGVEKNYAKALLFFQSAARQGSARANYSLGILYMNGQGVKQDYSAARARFQAAASAGDTNAETDLGYLYDRGLGGPQDLQRALELYTRAAQAGNALAQHNLGDLYLRGEGVPQSDAIALMWFRKAAAQGQTGAEIKLAYMLAEGRGARKDPEQAYRLLSAAAEAGDNRGEEMLRSLRAQLNQEQIQRANQQPQHESSANRETANAFVP